MSPFLNPFSEDVVYFDGEKSFEGRLSFDGKTLVFELEGLKLTLTDEKEKAEYGGIAFESTAHSSRFSSLFETLKSGRDLDQGKLLRIKD